MLQCIEVFLTGEEYLHHVIYERKHCKEWVTVDIDRTKFESKRTVLVEEVTQHVVKNAMRTKNLLQEEPVPKAHESLLPSKDWQQQQIKDFLLLRKYVAEKAQAEPQVNLIHESHWEDKLSNDKPTFSEIVDLKQSAKLRLLQFIYKKLCSIPEGYSIHYNVAKWTYALLAALELPLSPINYHELRLFAKELARIRSHLSADSNKDDSVPLNLFICLIGRVFGQLDLADDNK